MSKFLTSIRLADVQENGQEQRFGRLSMINGRPSWSDEGDPSGETISLDVRDYIDDEDVSEDFLWSSHKINAEFESLQQSVNNIIDDAELSEDSTWSSTKINFELDALKDNFENQISTLEDSIASVSDEFDQYKSQVARPSMVIAADEINGEAQYQDWIIWWTIVTTSGSDVVVYATDDRTENGTPVFKHIGFCIPFGHVLRDTDSDDAAPIIHSRGSVDGKGARWNIRRSNTGTIVLRGSYQGTVNNDNTVTLRVGLMGPKNPDYQLPEYIDGDIPDDPNLIN